VPLGLQQKPLKNIYLTLERETPDPLPQGVQHEELMVRPLNFILADELNAHPRMQDAPADVLAHYTTIAERIEATTLDNELHIGDILPAGAIVADYWASFPDRTRHIGTLKQRPAKASIVAGAYFAEEALGYVQSPAFSTYTDPDEAGDTGQLRHEFQLDYDPELPLNGHETTQFLLGFAEDALRHIAKITGNLEKLRALQAPELILERDTERLASYQAATKRILHILRERRRDD
jgi:hypothetical protein